MNNELIEAIADLKAALEQIGAKPNQDFSFVMSKNLMFQIADGFQLTQTTQKHKASIYGIDIIEK